MPEAAETIVPMRTTVVAIISLKLSMAVAFICHRTDPGTDAAVIEPYSTLRGSKIPDAE